MVSVHIPTSFESGLMYKKFLFLSFLLIQTRVCAVEININWFKNFNDPNLEQYLELALNCNKDIKIAKQNILKYRQEKNLNISALFPEINVGADYLLLKIPKTAIPRNDIQTNSFALPFSLNWEVDYLLKNYNKVQMARFDIQNKMLELKKTNLIALVDAASAYFNASNINLQIKKQEEIKENAIKTLKRKEKMFKTGVINEIELNLYKKNLFNINTSLNNLKKEREIFLSNLAYLTGQTPYNLDIFKITEFDKINYRGIYPENLKGSAILNRPDVEEAENEIKKAKIDITIAKKDFLPKINIGGVMVFSTVVQNFGWDGVFAALLAGATQNLFDGGKKLFTLKTKKIEYETKIETYLKTDLNALKELNDSLYALKKDYETFINDEKKLKLAEDNFIKILKSYNAGAKSYIDYLEEKEKFLNSDMEFFNSKNRNFNNLLTLFKTTGGGL